MRSAWRRIDMGTHTRAHDTARAVNEVAVKTRMVVRVFLHHVEMSARRLVSALAGRNRSVRHDLLAEHQVSALFRNGNHDVGVVRRRLGQQALIHVQRWLLLNQFVRLFHFGPE